MSKIVQLKLETNEQFRARCCRRQLIEDAWAIGLIFLALIAYAGWYTWHSDRYLEATYGQSHTSPAAAQPVDQR
jgi:hypothetical protein